MPILPAKIDAIIDRLFDEHGLVCIVSSAAQEADLVKSLEERDMRCLVKSMNRIIFGTPYGPRAIVFGRSLSDSSILGQPFNVADLTTNSLTIEEIEARSESIYA